LALYPTRESFRFISAGIIALAVCSMHYTGMYGAKFYYDSTKSLKKDWTMDSATSLLTALVFGMALSWVLISIAITDIRARNYSQSKFIAETDEMIKKIKNSKGGIEVNALLSKYTGNKRSSFDASGVGGNDIPTLKKMLSVAHPNIFGNRRSPAIHNYDERKTDCHQQEQNEIGYIFARERSHSGTAELDRKRHSLGIDSWASSKHAQRKSYKSDKSLLPRTPSVHRGALNV